MTVMYSFCLWFPVRLGAIIVAITCAVESLACLIAAVIGYHDLEGTSHVIHDWIKDNDLIIMTDFFISMRDYPSGIYLGLIYFLTLHIVTCPLVILGSFKCTAWYLYPFLVIEFYRLAALSILLVIFLLIIKANTLTLGLVIGFSIFGGFLLLYLWYQWFCVISLCQIIREVHRMDRINKIAPITYPANISQKISNQNYAKLYTQPNHYQRKGSYLPQPSF